MYYRAITLSLIVLVSAGLGTNGARADGGSATPLTRAEIVNGRCTVYVFVTGIALKRPIGGR